MRALSSLAVPRLAAALAVLLVAGPAHAGLRIESLDVSLDDVDATVQVALLDAIPEAFIGSLQSGIAARVRYTIELWQYNRGWRDQLLRSIVVERQLAYNVVTREFRVTSLRGERRPAYVTRELGDAQRVVSEVRNLRLGAAGLDPVEVFYVRVHAESSLAGENSFIARMTGAAEQASGQSAYRTFPRLP
jgi:uncharacterized protein DUF4390